MYGRGAGSGTEVLSIDSTDADPLARIKSLVAEGAQSNVGAVPRRRALWVRNSGRLDNPL